MSIEVRIATSDDWEQIKSMRIKSVELHPDVFAPKKHPKDLTIDEWKERAANSASVSFLLIDTKDNTPVGISGVYLESRQPQSSYWSYGLNIHYAIPQRERIISSII